MNKYDIVITRYTSVMHTVYADEWDEAKENALDWAFDHDWSNEEYDYEVKEG